MTLACRDADSAVHLTCRDNVERKAPLIPYVHRFQPARRRTLSPNVIVLDGDQRAALAVVRSLGERGLSVWVGSSAPRPLAAASRWCSRAIRIPAAQESVSGLTATVGELVDAHSDAIILPMTDATITALVDHSSLTRPRLGCAPKAPYRLVSDKGHLARLAHELNLPVPQTRTSDDRRELVKIIRSAPEPIVLKPAFSWYVDADRLRPTAVHVARTRAMAIEHVETIEWLGHVPCLVQEYIPGSGAGVFVLYGEDRPTAWFSHRRLREKPPGGGVSVLSESAPLPGRLKSVAEQLLSRAGWYGPAMVEFRVSHDGTAYLMEINGRFWGSLQLAIDAGVDFPWLFYQQLKGLEPATSGDYETGRRLRWLLGDLDSLLISLRDRSQSAAVKLRRFAAFLNFFDRKTRLEVLRLRDWKPFLRELRNWVRDLA